MQITIDLDNPNDVQRAYELVIAQRATLEIMRTDKPFAQEGVRLVHGTTLYKRYQNIDLTATIDNGKVLYEGVRYATLSEAALVAARTVNANVSYKPNGWYFWTVQKDNDWIPLNKLRK